MKISIIIPIRNEEENLEKFYTELKETLSKLKFSYEMIFVDDGSDDNSAGMLREIKDRDVCVKIVSLDKKRGQNSAYLAGLGCVSGDVIITIDADLQYDPGDIFKFVEKIDAGFDFVSGCRVKRMDRINRRGISLIGNRLINVKSNIKLNDWGCGFNVFRKELAVLARQHKRADKLPVKFLLVSVARSVGEVGVKHYPRRGGRSKYNMLNMAYAGMKFLFGT